MEESEESEEEIEVKCEKSREKVWRKSRESVVEIEGKVG